MTFFERQPVYLLLSNLSENRYHFSDQPTRRAGVARALR